MRCPPRLRYDRRTEHALSPTLDTHAAHALQLHAGDCAVLARCRERAVLLVDVLRLRRQKALVKLPSIRFVVG